MTTKICKCDNCEWTGTEDDLGKTLWEIHHLAERLDPGSTVPAGECPECLCLAYIVEERPIAAPDLLPALQRCVNYIDDDLHETTREEDPEVFALSDAAHAAIASAEELAKLPLRIAVTVEGGLVQNVITEDRRLLSVEVTVIDYDTEGADADKISRVPQEPITTDDSNFADAVVSMHEIGLAKIDLGSIRSKESVS